MRLRVATTRRWRAGGCAPLAAPGTGTDSCPTRPERCEAATHGGAGCAGGTGVPMRLAATPAALARCEAGRSAGWVLLRIDPERGDTSATVRRDGRNPR